MFTPSGADGQLASLTSWYLVQPALLYRLCACLVPSVKTALLWLLFFMATVYLHNYTMETSVSNILTTSRSHQNRLMCCCLCLAMPRVSNISIISQVSPCLGLIWNVLARIVSLHPCPSRSLCLRKNVLTPSASCMTRLITLSPTICQLPALHEHDKNRRFHRESGLAGIHCKN